MSHVELFDQHRTLLFSIAYRILGSVMDAEDLLQEAFLRWQEVELREVDSAKAFLTTVVTRLSIDHLRLARVQRESYIGPWLPEPLMTSERPGLMETAIERDSLSIAFMFLLERLTPVERAAFILRDVFDYEYAEIADVVDKSPQNVRQLVSRARRHLQDERPRFDVSIDEQQRIMMQFVQAVSEGDVESLQSVLAEDVVHYSDGNGMPGAARKPILGIEKWMRFFFGLQRLAPEGLGIRMLEVNGTPAILFEVDGAPYATLSFDFADGCIINSYGVVNPEKLKALSLGV
ncbi:MAG: RNA polymerase sigma-70 factor [Chloroflexi bacterium]|nr:MAG: RNA polymerase sigma-70 factor [Chloroflexota bacterium]MBL1196603.1 RNA polymerase sigma-70 factor [Chloroflexota bacterium]NOH13898.1 RNA polymerase sigma-70 factor [Chloroflexota bacterium]